ncbi:hypothetical protein OAM49_00065 [bacterium]|nr:hypothetical protein [bacterium]
MPGGGSRLIIAGAASGRKKFDEQPVKTTAVESTKASRTQYLHILPKSRGRQESSENREDNHPEQGRDSVLFLQILNILN